MTYIVKDVIDRLKASVPIANAVGIHVYSGVIPQREKTWTQAITVALVSGSPEMHLRGEAGVHTSIVQVDCWTSKASATEYDVNALAELVRNRLSGYRGTIGTGAYGTIRALPESGGAIPPGDSSDTHHRRYTRDYEIIHTAAVPTFA